MDEELRALERLAAADPGARFRFHAELDRRAFARPLTAEIEARVEAFEAAVGETLSKLPGLAAIDVAMAILEPSRSAEGVSWEWLDVRPGVLLVVREAGGVALEAGGPFHARWSEDDDGANVGERLVWLTPVSPPGAFVAWARQRPRASEEVAMRWARRVRWREDVGPLGHNPR